MPGLLCEHCTAVCCQYIALPIEAPQTRAEFDDVRWYLLHEKISVFVEQGEWYICMASPCRYLRPDFRCNIYAARPKICRQYSQDNCDYHSGDYGWEQHFTCPEHLDDYARRQFSNNKGGRKSKKNMRLKKSWNNANPDKSRAGTKIQNIKKCTTHRNMENDRKTRIERRSLPARPPAESPARRLARARADSAAAPLPVLRVTE